MSSPTGLPISGFVLTAEQIAQWEIDVRDIDAEISGLTSKRNLTVKRIEAARFLIESDPTKSVRCETVPSVKVDPINIEATDTVYPVKRRIHKGVTWSEVVLDIVSRADLGLTYGDVRAQAAVSELGARLKESDKGYHNAIGRLAREGVIVRQHGRLFTPDAYQRFEQAVDRGEASTVVPMPFAHSPMGEAILKIVWLKPGIVGKDIISELRKDVEFNATLTPHETGAYNIIARLVKRRQIIRRDDGGCIPGPDFPRSDLGLAPEQDRALNGDAVSALMIGEGASSSIESSARFGDLLG